MMEQVVEEEDERDFGRGGDVNIAGGSAVENSTGRRSAPQSSGSGSNHFNTNSNENHTGVELSKPSAFTVMAQQAQKVQAELIAKKNNFESSNNYSNNNTSNNQEPVDATSTLVNRDDGGDGELSGKLETIGEENTEDLDTNSMVEQYSTMLTEPSGSYEIIDAPFGHSAEPPPLLPPITEEKGKDESNNVANNNSTQKISRRKMFGKLTTTSSVGIPTPASSGLTEITWTTSSGVQQSSQSLTFGFGSASNSLTIASPFDTVEPVLSPPTTTSVLAGDGGSSSGTSPARKSGAGVSSQVTTSDAMKQSAADVVRAAAASPFSVPHPTTKQGAPCEIEEEGENLSAVAPSSSPPNRNLVSNLIHRMSFRASSESNGGEPRVESEPAPPPAALQVVDTTPPIQWRSYKPGQKLIFVSGHNHSNTVYYIESGMVELRWEATLAVPLTRVLSTMQHPSRKFSTTTSNASTTSNSTGGGSGGPNYSRPNSSGKESYMNRIDSVALAVNKVTTLPSGRPGSAGSNATNNSGAVMDRSETMANTLQQAAERAEALMVNATGGSLDNLLLSHRGASQFVGALSMLDPEFFADRWKACAVAQTDLVVIQMTRAGLDTFLSQNPLAQVHLRASMARGQAEITKLEALERIADAHRRKRYSKHTGQPQKRSSSWKFSDVFGVSMADAAEAMLGPISENSSLTTSNTITNRPGRDGDAVGAQETAGLDVFALVSKLRNEAQGVNWTDLLGDDAGGK
jgi:hypothetical protein